ncbi:MAG: outer membrane protein assembly factor BamA [Verrucomicrobia bacterium]|nr:outer membrane protein assembly factor BamA [Verrucomicrobiota bacterium]MBU4246793.1 outer membrane protein assembly factor BamA [Verrucomicrobiota bacterium]MBU4496597.1 outer membrane protein assembly factor BamA [Verrucomicrobiota bacterium]MCG2681211.1 outer membrane protein assembly factor BamA [Kiritimatiellia bacterium]
MVPALLGAAVIKEIKIDSKGVRLPDPEFVLDYTSTRVGNEVDQRQISRDVKTLQGTGRFSFIDTELTRTDAGFILTYIVEIIPKLGKPLAISGADALGESKVRKWMELEAGDLVSDAILNQHGRKVLDEYRSRYYFDTRIKWTIDVDPATGFATVHLTVKEGDCASLRKVEFKGNTYQPPPWGERLLTGLKHQQAVSPQSVPPDVLQAAMKPRLWHILSFFTKRGMYNPDDLNGDRDLLRAIYQNRGYLDAQINEPQVREYSPKKLMATYTIQEGSQYRIGALALRGATLFPESNLWAMIKLKTGDIASMEAISRTAANLRDFYQRRGYMRSSVKPLLSAHPSNAVVNIQFDITEGTLVNIRYIDIRGNTRTKDKVIRRELTVYPGEVYDQVGIRRSERILQNLGFFADNSVRSYPQETLNPLKDDVIFEVEEGKTGNFMIGAGYSSIDDVIGFVELTQGNFDLFNWPYFTGDGQKLRLRTQFGSQTEDYQLSFVEPWFLDRKLSLGVDLYDTVRRNLSDYYTEQRIGGAVTLGKPLPWFFQRANLTYRLERISIYSIASNAVERIQDEKGNYMDSSLKLAIVHDTRDNLYVPQRGNKSTLSARLSGGPLGFDVDVYNLEAETMSYFPALFDHTLSVRLWAETVQEYGDNDDVHIFDRLFLGGAKTLRGFKYRYVSPYEGGDPIGGKSGAMGTLEYTIPIYKKIFRFAAFYDIGNVWLDAFDFDLSQYCSDAGIGLRLDISSFPIRVDYAWPLDVSGDVSRTAPRFNFWIGYGF